jgi:hypothetical protein
MPLKKKKMDETTGQLYIEKREYHAGIQNKRKLGETAQQLF